MKITVITSSPKKYGTTALLTQEFINGAKEVGHEIFRFDSAFNRIAACTACDYCKDNDGNCVFNDGMNKLYLELMKTDCIVFVTPLYYFGFSAQLKAVIDRFYAINDKLQAKEIKSILLASAADDEDSAVKALQLHYETIVSFMKWQNIGMLFALGCSEKADILKSDYPEKAYLLGNSL